MRGATPHGKATGRCVHVGNNSASSGLGVLSLTTTPPAVTRHRRRAKPPPTKFSSTLRLPASRKRRETHLASSGRPPCLPAVFPRRWRARRATFRARAQLSPERTQSKAEPDVLVGLLCERNVIKPDADAGLHLSLCSVIDAGCSTAPVRTNAQTSETATGLLQRGNHESTRMNTNSVQRSRRTALSASVTSPFGVPIRLRIRTRLHSSIRVHSWFK
jgi:hypothetical protein